jgi:hypothetical protein
VGVFVLPALKLWYQDSRMPDAPVPPGPQITANPPVATPKPPINTRNAHYVSQWIKHSIRDKRLKDCWNLQINKYSPKEELDGEIVETGQSFFAPFCTRQSFEVDRMWGGTDHMILFALQHRLQDNPISCPADCAYYRNRRWATTKHYSRRFSKSAANAVRGLLKWFAELKWQTQVTLIGGTTLVLILWKAPQWVPALVALARAIWGKGA